ncbi:hypothetical protein ACFPYJ_31350 [Paenibacillus solisilvae]|uniref:Uncharacterized protein n=1 Tax=Paenibacillus solisilvae TaxID=2486751 RepID=A0ABW0W9Y5_9BACL
MPLMEAKSDVGRAMDQPTRLTDLQEDMLQNHLIRIVNDAAAHQIRTSTFKPPRIRSARVSSGSRASGPREYLQAATDLFHTSTFRQPRFTADLFRTSTFRLRRIWSARVSSGSRASDPHEYLKAAADANSKMAVQVR